jgi:tetratricopeptide (TPR) repeat protein
LKQYQLALSDFQKSLDLRPGYYFALAGLAITYHALGQVEEARRLWNELIAEDSRYRDAEWVKKELNWVDALVEEARKLIAKL